MSFHRNNSGQVMRDKETTERNARLLVIAFREGSEPEFRQMYSWLREQTVRELQEFKSVVAREQILNSRDV